MLDLAGYIEERRNVSDRRQQGMPWVGIGGYLDRTTWAMFGPGAARGLQRYLGTYERRTWEERRWDALEIGMQTTEIPAQLAAVVLPLLAVLRMRMGAGFDMFELEHNLCEWDKYCRIWTGESKGRPYKPRPLLEGGVT